MLGLGNPDLRWQQKMNYNAGIEASFFKNRLNIVADLYLESVNDLVSSVDLPASNGFTSYIENIGKMENRGYSIFSVEHHSRHVLFRIHPPSSPVRVSLWR